MKIRPLLLVSTLFAFSIAITAQGTLTASPPPVNSASFVRDLPSGGALATLFVFGLTGKAGLVTAPSTSPLPFELAGVRVTVNGATAPILAVLIPDAASSAPGLINFQVPLERNASFDMYSLGAASHLIVGQTGAGQIELPISDADHRGGFFSNGNGFVIAQHASDLSLVTTQNPAHPGETIIAYANDFFQVWPPPPIGIPVPPQPSFQATGVGSLFLQGYPDTFPPMVGCATTPSLTVLAAGLAPGMIGVEQLKIIIPANQQPGDWSLFFSSPCPIFNTQSNVASPNILLPVR